MSAPFPEITGEDGRTLAVVGIYPSRTEAYERSLVVAASETPHWLLRHEGQFALCVRPPAAEAVSAELERFEAERLARPIPAAAGKPPKFSSLSLYICAWILCGLYAVQWSSPAWWAEAGTASSREIMAGQWWRTGTALTLHADLGHIGANLAAGLIYAGFLLSILGAGWTWLFILLAGCTGNWLNAWGHRDIDHLSIGASTAVFAALGILVAAQATMRALELRAVRFREFLLPIGAGLGLLAYLGGAGDQQTDATAHLFGFLAGVPFGIAGASLHLGARTPPRLQALLAWSAAALLGLCWLEAVRHR